MDFQLSPNEKFDKKWGSVDIQAVLDFETLPSLWFGLLECHEVAVETGGNCSKLDFSKKVDSSESSRSFCFSEENKTGSNNGTDTDSSSAIFNSWLWKHTSDMMLVEQCLTSAVTKQRKLTNKLLSDTLPFCYIKQQLLLTERCYIAMHKNTVACRQLPGKKQTVKLQIGSKGENKNAEIQMMRGDPTQCLAQVGSRAILSFAFAFLKRAWRSGEDGDLCSDLLKEALDILRCLPVATFFNESCFSGVWIEVIEKSKNFFASVAKGEIMAGSGMSSQQTNCLPIKDRQIALFLYLELSLLQGTLPAILDAVLFMIQLSALCYCQDNQKSKGLFFSPLIPFLKRFSDAISQHRDSLPCENVDEDDKVKHNYLTTSNTFLKYLELPGDASVMINLKEAAVICMCHLDFLACKYLKEYANTNMNFDCRQEFISSGHLVFLNSQNFASLVSEVVDNGNVKQIVCSKNTLLLLTHCGSLYMLNLTKNSKFQRVSSEVKKFVDIASHWKADHFLAVSSDGSAFSWGKGNSGQLGQGTDNLCLKVPTLIKSLSGKFIRKISCNDQYSALISDIGELYICGGSPRKLMSDDICIPTLVPLPDKVVDVACETPDSPFIACCNGGLYTVTKKSRNFQTTFNHEFCTSMAHVEITKISVGPDGLVAAVSKLGQLYMWNSSSEESKLFRALAEKSLAVDDIVSLNFGARVTDVCFTEIQLLLLLESGQVLCWNEDGSEDKLDGDGCFIRGRDYRRHHATLRADCLKFIGICCAADHSFAWTAGTSAFVPIKKEFLVDLKVQTFEHLNNLLSIICDSTGGHQNWPPSQDEECLAVSTLNLLNLQLRCIKSYKVQENLTLLHNVDLLVSLKQKVIILASNRGVLTSIQEAAQAVLCGGWQVLAPSHKERSKLLTNLLTQKKNGHKDFQSKGLSSGEKFMIELLINSLMAGEELESCVGSLFLVTNQKHASKVIDTSLLVLQPNSKSKSDMINMTRSQESVKDSKNSLLQQASMFSNLSRFQFHRDRNQSDVPATSDDDDDDDGDDDDTFSIMHLIELLLCNMASDVNDRIKIFGSSSSDSVEKLKLTHNSSSLVKLILKFQRLFFMKMLDIEGGAQISFCPEPDVLNASSQLKKYVAIVCHSVADVLQKVLDIKVSCTISSTAPIIEKDFVGVVLQELTVSLLLLEGRNSSVVHYAGLDESLIFLLEKLNCFVKLYTKLESEDDENSWANSWIRDLKRQRGQRKAQGNIIHQSDLENLLKEGCFWVRNKEKVYDVKQLISLLEVDEENLKQYIGKLSSDTIWPGFYNIDFVKKLESCIIGYYTEGDDKEKLSFSDRGSPLVHCLRMLSLLIGMQARKQAISTALSDSEVTCSTHLKSSFLYGGLQAEASTQEPASQEESHRLHHKTCQLKRGEDHILDGEKPTIVVNFTGFINSYLTNDSSQDVQRFQDVIKSYCSSHSLFLPAAFAPDHPLSETTRFVISVLLRHLDLWEDVQEVLRSDIHSKQPSALPESLANICKIVCQAKKILVKVHQDSGMSYKEVCSSVLERCKFLLYEVKPGVEADLAKPSTSNNSQKRGSRWEQTVEKLLRGRKTRITRLSRNEEMPEDRNLEQKNDKNCHQRDDAYFFEDNKLDVKDDKFGQWSLLLYMLKSFSSFKRVLVCDIMEFLLNQENINVDLLRQALLNQSVRASIRLKGLQNMTSLIQNSNLSSISIFNLLFGWQGFLEKKQIELPLCLANIDLVPAAEKVMLEQAFDELNSWIVNKLRETLLNIELEAADLCTEEKSNVKETSEDAFEKVQTKHSLENKRRGSLPTCSQLFLNMKDTTLTDELLGDFDGSLEILKTSPKQQKCNVARDHLPSCSKRILKASDPSERGKLEQHLPSSRFASLLISILTTQHSKSSLENIINSGILPLARTGFRLFVNENEIEDRSSKLNDERDFQALVEGFLDDREAIYSTFDGLKIASALKVGSRVVRGPNWNWGEQDGPQPGIGTVMSELDEDGWVRVEWDTGSSHLYRMGKDNKYDLMLYEGQNHSTYLNKAKEEIHAYFYKRSLLSGSNGMTSPLNFLFCNVITNLMNCLCLNVLVLKDQMLNNFTASKFACHLRDIIDSSYTMLRKDDCPGYRGKFKFLFHGCHVDLNHWVGFGFVRSISSNSAVSKKLARFHWINELLESLTLKDVPLMQKLQILLLLEVILPQYDEPGKFSKMKLIVSHLIEILGSLASGCPYDMSLRNNDLLAFCSQKMSKTFHLLSASHTSTIAEQLRSLLANLHNVQSWAGVINEHISCQLNNLSEFFISQEECGGVPGGGFQLLGVLAFLGGVDETKLRLGGRVWHEEFGNGTVAGININGDVSIQFDQNICQKSCYYKELVVKQISLGDLFGECSALEPWAKMLYSALCLSTSYKDCEDPSSSHSELPIRDESGKPRQQCSVQNFLLRFFLLKAVGALFNNQKVIRKVLLSNVPQLFLTNGKSPCHTSDIQKVSDQFAEADSNSSQVVSIFQRIIQLSTQPCPIRPNFDLHDIQLALISLFQALTSGAFDDVPQSGEMFPAVAKRALAEDVPLLLNHRQNNSVFDLCKGTSFQENSAIWKSSKYLLAGSMSFKNADEFDDCEEEGATGGNIHNSFHLVQQLMDMGFPQKKIHCALKDLASSTYDESPLIEAAVTWLLEHEDHCPASVDINPAVEPMMFCGNSEEPQDVELGRDTAGSEDSPTATKARYLTKQDFQGSDLYASYVKDNIKVGMVVKCCEAYDDIRLGDNGVVEELDSDGLHDLNVQVDWLGRGSYWTEYNHIDLNGDGDPWRIPASTIIKKARENDSLEIGDRVRVKQSIKNPFFGWGLINHSSVGTITGLSISGMEATVNFNQQSVWNGLISELEAPSFPVPPHSSSQSSPSTCRKKLFCCSPTNAEPSYFTSQNSRNEILRLQNVPQSFEKHEVLLHDWKKCIKSVQVSSGDDTALYLFGSKGGYWQSCGMIGKHWIRLEMQENVLVNQLTMTINPCDSNYVPSLIVVMGGSSPQQCNKELKLTRVSIHDVDVSLLENVNQFYKFIEIQIRQCNNEGIDCRVHSVDIVGRLCYPDSIETFNHLSYLASDYNLEDSSDAKVITKKSKLVMNSKDVQHTFVFVWGLNDKDQLGGPKGSKIKIPVLNEILSSLKCVQIAGGSKSLFCVTQDGKLYASGEATNGRLGLGLSSGHVTIPRQLTSLSQYVIKKVAVHSGGRHALALTVDGKVFSWGEGDDGKLGHFSSMSCEKPKLIESLRSKRVRDIACGSSHSAAIISNGDLYTWGLGEYGRLGHGDSNTQKRPKLVVALAGQRVIQVSLGSRDAQTLALTDEGIVYSWGDGDFGKLGRGGSEGCNVPQVVQKLNNLGVCQVECGAQFSLALTKSGQVWTWGKGDYFRLGHGTDAHVRKPQLVESLKDKKVVHVAVGALHCLAVTDVGKVYAWGDNDHGQQGNGTTAVNKKPVFVHGLEGYKIAKVSCGSSHSVAWCTADVPYSCSYEPVTFFPSQDPLGAALSAGGSNEDNDLEDYNKSDKSESFASMQKLSLAHIILSLDTRLEKLHAVGHLIRGLQIYYARTVIIEAVKPADELSLPLSQKLSTSSIDGCKDFSPLISPLESPLPTFHLSHSKLPTLGLISTVPKDGQPGRKSNDTSLGEMNVSAKELNSTSMEDVFKRNFKSSCKYTKIHSADREEDVPRVSSSSCPELMGSGLQKRNETGSLASKHPLTLPSLSSRSNDAMKTSVKFFSRNDNLQVGDGSEICSVSVPPDNFVAAFSECDEGTKESYTPKTDSPTTPGADFVRTELDEFTRDLSVDDARTIVDLLKFAAAGRVCRQAQKILSQLLNNLARFNLQVSEMLLELCVTELEDVSVNTIPGSKSSPVVQESPHPYIDNSNLSGTVRISGAESLRVEFDRQCSTERRHDHLTIMDSNMKILSVRSGREFCNWSQELIVPGDELHWKFRSDGSVNGWGWKFTVYRVSSEFPGRDHSLSDRTLISRPSIHLVMSLLDFKLPHSNDQNIILRLAASLAACSQITSLGSSQKIWILKKLRTLMTSHFGKNINIRLMMSNPSHEMSNCSSFVQLVKRLPETLLRQFEYEDPIVRSGKQLTFSRFFKVLVGLSCDLGLDSFLSLSEQQNQKWGWFHKYCLATRVACSLQERTELPSAFCDEVLRKIRELSEEDEPVERTHENQKMFTMAHDEQLLLWLNRKPDDWVLTSESSGQIWVWGHNHRGQLGGVEGAKIKVPVACEALSVLRPVQIVGGEQTLFAVTGDGKVYASGYGAGGRLGIGSTDSVSVLALLESIQHVHVKKVSVNSGGKHCLALTSDGDVFSWGEGEDGKLGHGSKTFCDRPRVIETLRGKDIVDVAAGGAHSACISARGELYTWGKGRYGRLGHGDGEDQLKPKLVEFLKDHKVIDVACGSGDAQTLCLTSDDSVWSWGDGDYGKLGRGGSEGCKVPMKVESLQGLGVINVECGSQFSVALTRTGSVYTWGKGDYHRLGHGPDDHVRKPKRVLSLQGKKIVSIACGSLHCVCCTDTGEVYTWGDNDEGQLGDGSMVAIQKPRIVAALQGKKINKLACGSAHSFAWSSNKPNYSNKLPQEIPMEFNLLQNINPRTFRNRLILLHHFSDIFCPCISMIELDCSDELGTFADVLRGLLALSAKEAVFKKVVQATMVRDKPHGPVIEINRIQVKRSRNKGGLAGVDGMKSVFGQICLRMGEILPDSLMLPHRVWKVKFIGESVDDCGGGYSESIAEICDELQNGSVGILIQTPNGRDEAGTNRDCFVLNPNYNSSLHHDMFKFFGMLLGIAIRTGSPLNLNLAEPVWKQFVGLPLSVTDFDDIDRDFVPGLMHLKDMEGDSLKISEMPYSTTNSAGTEIKLGNKFKRIDQNNKSEYIKQALAYRLHEFDEQVDSVRKGMSHVIPVPLLSLFTGLELETMVCGSPDIPVNLLKSVATYKGIEPSTDLIQWFWEVMEDFTNVERSLFLRFVWGRTRLPRTIADFRGRDFVIQVLDRYDPPDNFLPESYTCFFLLKMPKYSNKNVLKEKLKYAIHFCKSIDTDDYARIALASPHLDTESSNDNDEDALSFNNPSDGATSTDED